MEKERTFVIEGTQRFWMEWLFTLVGCFLMAFQLLAGKGEAWAGLLVLTVLHILAINKMSARITVDARGITYRSLFEGKGYFWDRIADYGIVCKKRMGKHGAYDEYTLFFSDTEGTRNQATRHLPYRGIRMRLRPQDAEPIAGKLRTFGREYAKSEPYISEYWGQ